MRRDGPNLAGLLDACVDDLGRPLRIQVTRPLGQAQQRLLDTLGVIVEVVGVSSRTGPRPGSKPDRPVPRHDWVDHRASVANAFRRLAKGEEVVRCDDCGCELDVAKIAHSPKCVKVVAQTIRRADAWTRGEVVEAMQNWAADHGGDPPTMQQWSIGDVNHPRGAVVSQLFGSWNDGLEAAGLSTFHGGRNPRRNPDEQEPAPEPSVWAMTGEDGEVGDIIGASSPAAPARKERKTPVREKTWTRERILEAMQRWAASHGGFAPTATEWFVPSEGLYPAVSLVRREFGSWSAGIAASGLPLRPSNRRRKAPPARTVEPELEILVPGTGLRYTSVADAIAAAAEVVEDGRRVAAEARADGQHGQAEQALEASVELAEKILSAAGEAAMPQVEPESGPEQEVDAVVEDAEHLNDDGGEIGVSEPESGALAFRERIGDLDVAGLLQGDQDGWIALLEQEQARLRRRAEGLEAIIEGLRIVQETNP